MENTKALKILFTEFEYCIINNLEFVTEQGTLAYEAINGVTIKDKIIFSNCPEIIFTFNDQRIEWMEISAVINLYDQLPIHMILEEYNKKTNRYPRIMVKLLKNPTLIKGLLKRVYKKVYSLVLPKDDSIMYCIDLFETLDNHVNIRGWIFSSETMLEDIKVCAKTCEEEFSFDVDYGLLRTDCYAIFNNDYAMKSGFTIGLLMDQISDVKFYLQYEKKNKTKKIYIGQFRSSDCDINLKKDLIRQEGLIFYDKKGENHAILDYLINFIQNDASFWSEFHEDIADDFFTWCKNDKAITNTNLKSAKYSKKFGQTYNDFIAMICLSKLSKQGCIVGFDHINKDASSAFLNDIKDRALQKRQNFVRIKYEPDTKSYLIDFWHYNEGQYYFRIFDFHLIYPLFQSINVTKILINKLVSYPQIDFCLQTIMNVKQKLSAKLTFYFHDFYALCPSYFIHSSTDCCRMKSVNQCMNCLCTHPSKNAERWRNVWYEFFKNCDEVILFSNDLKSIIKTAYPKLFNITVTPYETNYLPKLNKKFKKSETVNIGILGVSGSHCGLDIVRQMVKIIEKKNLFVNIILIGVPEIKVTSNHIVEIKNYTLEALPNLVFQYDIDMFMLPTLFPEISMMNAHIIRELGMPIAYFNLINTNEDVVFYEKNVVIHSIDPELALEKMLSYIKKTCPTVSPYGKILFIYNDEEATTRYRVKHFSEQLAYLGVYSDSVLVNRLNGIDISKYVAVEIFRCPYTKILDDFIHDARMNKIPVFYGIDDLLFNDELAKKAPSYNALGGQALSDVIHLMKKSMEDCDAYIFSTNTLDVEAKKVFLEKETIVNKNVASAEMLSLSLRAKNTIKRDKSKIVLGYYGTIAHTYDFFMLKDVIIQLMETYDNLYLSLTGPFRRHEEFERFQERIQYLKYRDWRELPKVVAGFDLAIMPIIDTPLHLGVSENKWMETGLLGVPIVASKTPDLSKIIRHMETGLLCQSLDDWYSNISMLITDESLRKKIGEQVHQEVLSHYLTVNTGKEAMDFIINFGEGVQGDA